MPTPRPISVPRIGAMSTTFMAWVSGAIAISPPPIPAMAVTSGSNVASSELKAMNNTTAAAITPTVELTPSEDCSVRLMASPPSWTSSPGARAASAAAAEAARAPGLDVQLGGDAIRRTEQSSLGVSSTVGVIAAAVVLFIAFSSLLATLLPLVTAIAGIGGGLMAIAPLTHAMNVVDIAPILGTLIGLGVGIDYALFIVTRHRRGLQAGLPPEEAVVQAINTSGRAVLFAGSTVCIALLGILVLGVSFLNGLAVASALTVVFTVLAAVTLLPALLGVFQMRVLGRRQRRRLVAGAPAPGSAGLWARWSETTERRPAVLAIAATAVMVLLAIPVLSLRLGSSDQGNNPSSTTTR